MQSKIYHHVSSRRSIKYRKTGRIQRQKRGPKMIIFTGLFFLLLGGLTYLLFFWSGWRIVDVKVNMEEDQQINKTELASAVNNYLDNKKLEFLPANNILLLPIEDLANNLLALYPQIAKIEIDKKIHPSWDAASSHNTIELTVTKRQSVAIWCQVQSKHNLADLEAAPTSSQDITITVPANLLETSENSFLDIKNCYYLDKEGVVFRSAPITQGGLISIIYDYRKGDVGLGKNVVTREIMSQILIILEELPSVFRKVPAGQNLDIAAVNIISVQQITAVTSEQWEIYFSTAVPTLKQTAVLEKVLLEQIKDQRLSLQYVDLRIANRAYYK